MLVALGRRELIAAVGSAAIVWPFTARAQHPANPVVGILSSGSYSAFADLVGAFRTGLTETGYIEGKNVVIESRWAEGHFERLPNLIAELAERHAAVIVTTGGSSTFAVKAAHLTIPHVFLVQDDPVKLDLVASFNKPGGNATGISLLTSALVAKRQEFVRQLAPADAPISYLMNPSAPEAEFHLRDMQAAARESGQQINVLKASSEREIDSAFKTLAISGLASGTFIPLAIGFVVQNLPAQMVIYGVAAYSLNLELSLNIAASIEGWFDDYWSWKWIFWDTALLTPLMLICIVVGMPRQPINRALLKTADWAGMLYASVGFSLLYAGLDQGNRLDWLNSGLINALLFGGALLLVVFVIHELTYDAERGGPLIVSADPLFVSRYNQIVVLAAFHKIPAIL